MIPYPTDRMIINAEYDRGYQSGYSAGRKEILNKLEILIKTYDDAVDLAYEINYLLYCEKEVK